MLVNYLKICLRNLLRFKVFSLISILGLALGMACCFLVMLWIMDELRYDGFHEYAPDLYRVVRLADDLPGGGAASSQVALGPAMKTEIPEIIDTTRVVTYWYALRHGDQAFNEGFTFVDPSFLRMFTFPVVRGDADRALDDPFSIVITESTAKKYFGKEDPIGKILTRSDKTDYTVTAVTEDPPRTSHLSFNILVHLASLPVPNPDDWIGHWLTTYVQVQRGHTIEKLNRKISEYTHRYIKDPALHFRLKLQPISDIHLYSEFAGESPTIGVVYLYATVALLLILIACINYMNLSTARYTVRSMEIGIRKVVGARRTDLIIQFLGESLFLSTIAFFSALAIVGIVLPEFNTLSGKMLSLDPIGNIDMLAGFFCISVFTGILAGSYPAVFLSGGDPARVLKRFSQGGSNAYGARKVLIVVQFTIAISVVVCTGITYHQIEYMTNKALGYRKDNVISVFMPDGAKHMYDTFRDELQHDSNILGVSSCWHNLVFSSNSVVSELLDWEGKDPANTQTEVKYTFVDYGFFETLGMDMVQGRSFSEAYPTDWQNGIIINERALKMMSLKEPLQSAIRLGRTEKRIIGVVRDFHFLSLFAPIEPLFILMGKDYPTHIFVRVHPENRSAGVDSVEETWKKLLPNFPLNHRFHDQELQDLYGPLDQFAVLLKYASFLTVLIAAIGLFGLVFFTMSQKTKEIGIRKVHGASTASIVWLLLKEHLKLVLVANIIALPVAYSLASNRLQTIAYRTGIEWGLFVLAAGLSALVALLTVSYHTLKVARTNPADSLRYE